MSLIGIVESKGPLPVFAITPEARSIKEAALVTAALIGRVTNADENAACVQAQKELKRISSSFEKHRKTLKEPLLEAGRQLDRTVALELAEIQQEEGRLSVLTSEFQLEERRRVQEEERLQRAELDRIDRDRQAELKRIADEQSKIEREAREAMESAARIEREATTKADREAADAAYRAAAEKTRLAKESASAATSQAARVDEAADTLLAAEAVPIQTTRVVGQVVKTDWEIQILNPYELAKFHPDCVKIEALVGPIKRLLNEGFAVKGIRASKVTVATVRAGKEQPAINV